MDKTIIIWDWDDTLYPSTMYRINNGQICRKNRLSNMVQELLKASKQYGIVYILTNGNKRWLDECLKDYEIHDDILKEIRIICTPNYFPNCSIYQRKSAALNFIRHTHCGHIDKINIVAFTDSSVDRTVFMEFKGNQHNNIDTLAHVKFKNNPTERLLLAQLELINKQFKMFLGKEADLMITINKI